MNEASTPELPDPTTKTRRPGPEGPALGTRGGPRLCLPIPGDRPAAALCAHSTCTYSSMR